MRTKARGRGRKTSSYDENVFINCPFDDRYATFFQAIIFTVLDCGFLPRCALETIDSGQVRIEKIFAIVEESKLGVHDISRTGLDPESGLPRFNMPLELGFFLAAKRFGGDAQKSKSCIIFDTDRTRYQAFMSDIAGQDIAAHGDQTGPLIDQLRDWLANHSQKPV